jgi:hypothetical protein
VELKQRWMVICEQAAIEQDPNKLTALTNEIIRLLDEKPTAGRVMSIERASNQRTDSIPASQ